MSRKFFFGVLLIISLIGKSFAENIQGTNFDLNNITGANDYVIPVNIMEGDIFWVYYEELKNYDTDLKKEMFLETAESEIYVQRINVLKDIIKTKGITVILPTNRASVSNYDTSKRGFWITIGNEDDGYYKPSINGYIYDKLSVTEEKSSLTGKISYKIFIPVSRENAIALDGKNNLRVKLEMKISGTRNVSFSAGGWKFNLTYPVASSMNIVIYDANQTAEISKEWDFENTSDGYIITKYKGKGTNIIIPENIAGKSVIAIETREPFELGQQFGVIPYSKNKVTVIIPQTIRHIGDFAFNYGNISTVVIPNSIASIGEYAFAGNEIEKITIPGGLSLSDGTFGSGFVSLYNFLGKNQGEYSVINAVNDQWEYTIWNFNNKNMAVIKNCKKNTNTIIIPAKIDNIAVIGIEGNVGIGAGSHSGIFNWGDTKVEYCVIENGINYIGAYSFAVDTSINQLTKITIPESITYIGEYAFSYNKLAAITIPTNIKSVAVGAFVGNDVTNIVIGSQIILAKDSIDNGFVEFYNTVNKKSGNYRYENGKWK